MSQFCPKCGRIPPMNGPFYEAGNWPDTEHLRFYCPCGFSVKVACKDAEKAPPPAPQEAKPECKNLTHTWCDGVCFDCGLRVPSKIRPADSEEPNGK